MSAKDTKQTKRTLEAALSSSNEARIPTPAEGIGQRSIEHSDRLATKANALRGHVTAAFVGFLPFIYCTPVEHSVVSFLDATVVW